MVWVCLWVVFSDGDSVEGQGYISGLRAALSSVASRGCTWVRRSRKLLVVGLIVFSLLTIGFVVWAETPLGPMPESLVALESDVEVEVNTERWLVFTPVESEASSGAIFYPGGRVDERSYAPIAHSLASRGYLVVIVPMPLNLAVFAPDRASEVISAFPEIQSWAIGGHSLGGAMASQYAFGNPAKVRGLFLLAAYPASGNNLSLYHLKTVSIYGTADGLATDDKIASSRALLPPSAVFVQIEGGNHAYFGWYGPQPGDGTAMITREEQQNLTVKELMLFLESIGG